MAYASDSWRAKDNSRPLNNGQILHAVMPPWLVNWPKETSNIKMGAPASTKQIKYGIRKHPEKNHTQDLNLVYPQNIVLAWETKLSVGSQDYEFGNVKKKNCYVTWRINKRDLQCIDLWSCVTPRGTVGVTLTRHKKNGKEKKVGKEANWAYLRHSCNISTETAIYYRGQQKIQ